MYYIKEYGRNEKAVLARVHSRYGANYTLISRRPLSIRRWAGLYRQQGWEYTFSVQSGEDPPLMGHRPPARVFPSPPPEDALQSQLLAKIEALESLLETRFSMLERRLEALGEPTRKEHESDPISLYLLELLAQNEFPAEFASKLIAGLSAHASCNSRLEAVHQLGMQVQSLLQFYSPLTLRRSPTNGGPRVVTLVGASGVGKTTTLAKLAAQIMQLPARQAGGKIKIVSLDSYRVGAAQQIQDYGKILNLSTTTLSGYSDLLRLVGSSGAEDLILIDTIGRNPYNDIKIAELKKILSACGQQEILLLLSATSSYRSSADALRCYGSLSPSAAVLTKCDESGSIGAILTAVIEANLPISYITNGQLVPNDMVPATPERILERLITPGMRINWSDFMRKHERRYLYQAN